MKRETSLAVCMLMAFAGFSVWAWGDAAIRYLNQYPVTLVAFVGDASTVAFFCLLAPLLGGFKDTFRKPKLKLRILRGFILAFSNVLSFIVFAKLDLATAYALIFVTPFLAKVLSALLLKEKISLKSWLISLTGFAGVLIVLRPGFIEIGVGAAAALGLCVFFALGYVMCRYIGEEHQTDLSLGFFQYAFVAIALAFPAAQAWRAASPDLLSIALMIGIGATGAAGSVLVARAFMAPTAFIAPIHYTQILWGVGLGALLFGEYPDVWTLAGGAVIITSGLALIGHGRSLYEKDAAHP